jgi:nicotinamidase-related amidase
LCSLSAGDNLTGGMRAEGPLTQDSALLIIDLQLGIDDPVWSKYGPRNNPRAEERVAQLLAAWRAAGRPVIHIRHDSTEPQSTYRPGQPGHDFKPEAMPLPGETVIAKRTNSAFIGTPLQAMLESSGIRTVFIAGVITNNSVEATVRMSGNLGFQTYLIEDACFTFARLDYEGRLWNAQVVHAMSLANLNGEYCTVVKSADLLEKSAG